MAVAGGLKRTCSGRSISVSVADVYHHGVSDSLMILVFVAIDVCFFVCDSALTCFVFF